MPDYRLKQDYYDVIAGTISEEWRDHALEPVYVFKSNNIELDLNKEEINDLLQRGIVEKLPEPKWRDEDMIRYAKYMVSFSTNRKIMDIIFEKKLYDYEKSRQTKNI